MLLKVCGMRNAENIKQLMLLNPDFVGFIFYPPSGRYVSATAEVTGIHHIPATVNKVGVFVNATAADIAQKIIEFGLQYVQLHGEESPDFCQQIQATGVKVIKAFAIAQSNDFDNTKRYAEACDYVLFDTKTPAYGGSGQKFDWNILADYTGQQPFFLSGGINSTDARIINSLQLPQLAALDLNSRFEVAPAMKDIDKIADFFAQIRRALN